MRSHIPAEGPNLGRVGDPAVLVVAVALMIAGVVMIFTGASTGVAIPSIGVGIALTAVVTARKRSGDG